MEDRIQAELQRLMENSKTARERLAELQDEMNQLHRFLVAASGAMEALQDLLPKGE